MRATQYAPDASTGSERAGGSRRVFRQCAWLEVISNKAALSHPTNQRVTNPLATYGNSNMNIEDAQKIIIEWFRNGSQSAYSKYGYDIYLPNVIRSYLRKQGIDAEREGHQRKLELSPYFYAAAGNYAAEVSFDPG